MGIEYERGVAVMRNNGNSGFTLAEVVVAALILGVGMAGVVGLILHTMNTVTLSQRTNTGVQFGQEKIEELLCANGAAGSGSDQQGSFDRVWTSTASTNGDTQITVTVSWPSRGGGTHEVVYNTMVYSNTPSSQASMGFQNIPMIP